jgi:hypothetical protein
MENYIFSLFFSIQNLIRAIVSLSFSLYQGFQTQIHPRATLKGKMFYGPQIEKKMAQRAVVITKNSKNSMICNQILINNAGRMFETPGLYLPYFRMSLKKVAFLLL